MLARGRQSAGHFWWRATEPIPARPERLAATDDRDEVPITAPPQQHVPYPPPVASPKPVASRPFDCDRPAKAADLGAYRPTASGDAEGSQPARSGGTSPPHTVAFEQISGVEGVYGPIPPGARRRLVRRRHALLAAGFAGALLFAVSTDFGRHVRHIDSMAGELDRLLVALGFGINEISLSGHRHTLDQDVFRALGASGATLLTLDVAAARSRVEALPWIESATLVRVFPDKLQVELRERKPAAVWHDGDRTALVDAEGRVLSYVAASLLPKGLPHIAGTGAPAAAVELREALARYPGVASRVRVAHRISDRRWDLELANGARVKLAAGATAASLERLVSFEQETRWLNHAGQVVDLTVPRSIAVSTPVPRGGASRSLVREAPARPL